MSPLDKPVTDYGLLYLVATAAETEKGERNVAFFLSPITYVMLFSTAARRLPCLMDRAPRTLRHERLPRRRHG